MDLPEYLHTKREVILNVYTAYLQGASVEEINCKFLGEYSFSSINNIIDCHNYINYES